MQKNLGYVIPSLVIPDATNGIGYWYLGNVPLGVRATGTMWTIGSDHYWYVDNTKTNYLAEIPVEDYNQQFAELLSGYDDTWDTWLSGVQADWTTFFNTEGAAFTLWFNRMKNQLSTDAAGNLQAQIDTFCYNFASDVELYNISSQAYTTGRHIVWKNRYCLVTQDIAQGDTFVIDATDPNCNIEYTNLDEVIGSVPEQIHQMEYILREVDAGMPPSGLLTFNADGSITNTFNSNESMQTVFNEDGSISNIYRDTSDSFIEEAVTEFLGDGSIRVSRWLLTEALKRLPYDYVGTQAVVYNGEIHILGGWDDLDADDPQRRTDHYKYDATQHEWVSVSTLPYGFTSGKVVVFNNEIHMLGGGDSSLLHYKWDGTTWTQLSNIPMSPDYSAVVVYDNAIHLLGGATNHTTDHYKFDGTSWSVVSILPYACWSGAAVVLDGELHLLGGNKAAALDSPTKHYKFDGSTWTSVSTLPYGLDRFAVVYNGEIHILGNGTTDEYRLTHYKFNGTRWVNVSTLPYMFNSNGVVLNNNIYILGSNRVGVNYKLDAVYDGTKWLVGSV